MNYSPLISVIIPAYNVCEYIEKCVDSVINQTYTNLQIIIVNDGSVDDTGLIAEKLMIKDKRIRLINKNNGGLSSARNAGIDIAEGEWIAFLDSDDWIEKTMYEELLTLATNYHADIASCKSRNVYIDKTDNFPQTNVEKIEVIKGDDIVKGLLTGEKVRFEVWNKLWRRSFISNIRFIDGQISEDVHFDRVLFQKADKIVHTNRILHNYLVSRPGNTLSTFKYSRICIFDEFNCWMDSYLKSNNMELYHTIAMLAISFCISMYVEAYTSKQPKSVLTELWCLFNSYHSILKNSIFRFDKAINCFAISPRLYITLLNWKKSVK